MTPKRLILLASAASYRAGDFEKAAKRLGVEVVLGMDVPAPLAHTYSCPLPLDYLDVKRSTGIIVKYAGPAPVQAILAADDSATVLAAEASQALGLRHNAPEAAEAARDKYAMRRLFSAAGVPSPSFRLYPLNADPEQIADELTGTRAYPVVLKPRSLSGSRGVMRADDPLEFIAAYRRLRPIIEITGG